MVENLGHGIFCIDTGYQRPGLAACYLMEDAGEAALIETGTARSAPRILRALEQAGIRREAVRYLIPTHVHLDHAGGAGALLRDLPNALVLVHPRGARHLVEPARLVDGATAVYGTQRFEQFYGEVTPVPSPRLRAAEDGSTWPLGNRALRIRDTPGHARHHFCIWDEVSQGWFTGDTFGVAYRELQGPRGPFLLPTTTPVQFEPERLLASIDLLLSASPRAMYLTHHGRITPTAKLASDLKEQLEDYRHMTAGLDPAESGTEALLRGRLEDYTIARLRDSGCGWRVSALRRFLQLDLDLNAAGIMSWLVNTSTG